MLLFAHLLNSAAIAGPQAAATRDAPPADDQPTIVVTAQRDRDESIRDFVGALTHISPRRQLGRFEQSVCPIALGLPQRQGQAVASRMRQVAQEVKLVVGGTKCAPNVVVIVTNNKHFFMQELRRRYPHYFGDLSRREIRNLASQSGPASAWQLQGPPVSARGTELAVDPGLDLYVNRTTEAASRITSAARPQFETAIVVVERGALAGLSATQLADYAAMRAFAGADPARVANSDAPTILRILDAPMGAEVPITMTHWDLGFLRGFYSSSRNLSNGTQRSAIGKSVVQELEVRPNKR